MTEPINPDPARVLEANVLFHTALAEDYDRNQPHFRPENVARVTAILQRMAEETGGGSLIDLGCGTGFVINIAKRFFRRVVGVDITEAMLDRVDLSGGNVEVCLATTDAVPFEDEEFDACTAYGYLHHLYDLGPTFRESARLLRSDGQFFSDQDPNFHYWEHLTGLQRSGLTGFVAREVKAVMETAGEAAEETSLSQDEVSLAEYQKMRLGGFKADQVVELLTASGFATASYRYEWFLGQGVVLHEQGASAARVVENYLREALPATEQLFKYVSFSATK
jgi:ubiquinone/menaquinone biosynthesis C-methylase UbiE